MRDLGDLLLKIVSAIDFCFGKKKNNNNNILRIIFSYIYTVEVLLILLSFVAFHQNPVNVVQFEMEVCGCGLKVYKAMFQFGDRFL